MDPKAVAKKMKDKKNIPVEDFHACKRKVNMMEKQRQMSEFTTVVSCWAGD